MTITNFSKLQFIPKISREAVSISIVSYSPNGPHHLISFFRRYLPTRFEFYIKNCQKTMDSCCLFMRCHCREKIAILNIFILHNHSFHLFCLLMYLYMGIYQPGRLLCFLFLLPHFGGFTDSISYFPLNCYYTTYTILMKAAS